MSVRKGSQGLSSIPPKSARDGEELCPQTAAGRRSELDSLPAWERKARLPYKSP